MDSAVVHVDDLDHADEQITIATSPSPSITDEVEGESDIEASSLSEELSSPSSPLPSRRTRRSRSNTTRSTENQDGNQNKFFVTRWFERKSALFRRNQGCTTQKTIFITICCVLLSVFLIVPLLQDSLTDESRKITLSSGKSKAPTNTPTQSPFPSGLPTLSSMPSLSHAPSISLFPSGSPTTSNQPSISSLPSTFPSEPVPSSSPTINIVRTQIGFLFQAETYPLNDTAVSYYENELFVNITEGFQNLTITNTTLTSLTSTEQFRYPVEVILEDNSKYTYYAAASWFQCEGIAVSGVTNNDFNCFIRQVYNTTCKEDE